MERMGQVIERKQDIALPGIYEFQLHDRTPRRVVQEMFGRVTRELHIQEVHFYPARMREDGVVDPIKVNVWPTDFLKTYTPYHPRRAVLDIRGLPSELVFAEENSNLSGDPTWRSWSVVAKDLGSLELRGNQLKFTPPYPGRDGVLGLRLKGFLPKLDGYETDPEIFDPTKIWVNVDGTPGPLLSSILGYLNEIVPDYVAPFWYHR